MRTSSPSTPSLWRGGTVEAWASQDLQDRICGSLPLIPRARPKGGTARGWRGSQHAIRRPHLRHQIFRNSSADRFFQSPAPDRREEQRGGGGGASSRSACHRIEHRRSHLIGRSSTRTSPRPHQTVTARWRHLGRRRAPREKAPLPPKKYRFTGIVGAVEVLKL